MLNPPGGRKSWRKDFLDVSTVKQPVALGEVVEKKKLCKSNWQIMVDERTQLTFSNFFETKSRMVEPTLGGGQRRPQFQ